MEKNTDNTDNPQPLVDFNKQFETDITDLAKKYSLTRIQTESLNFQRDYRRAEEGRFFLTSEKAIIKALGKITKVPIGADQKCKTYDEAAAFARKHWSEYFKKRRATRSEAEKRGEARRQKRYRDKRRAESVAHERAQ